MSNAKHTPGPWIVNPCPSDCLEGKLSVETPDGYFIAQVDESECQNYNASLIAAAPELLEALEAIVRSAERNQAAINWPMLTNASAAIAKARGE